MATSHNREIWEKAIPLAEAWQVFSDKCAQLSEQPNGVEAFNELAQKSTDIWGLLKAASTAIHTRSDKLNLEIEMKNALLDELFNSDLRAVAYRRLPSFSSTPVMIDAEFFEFAEIEWEQNSAEYEGKRYYRIRVFDPHSELVATKQRIGRPSSGEAIDAAVEQLIREDSEFCNSPRKIQCDRIRKTLGKNHILGDGLSNPNLAKYILKRCPMRKIQ